MIHFAGLKSVSESVLEPLEYYNTNVVGSDSLLSAMKATGVFNIVFSSSATVYGDAEFLPFTEEHPLRVTNPYGRTKLIIEDMLRDLVVKDPRWSVTILRYFNPMGAHPSGLIGEDPDGEPTNLVPYILQVALGQRSHLKVFGDDYDTPDGTGVRDFIHVVDLAKAHVKALKAQKEKKGCVAINLGTGQGYSVLELIKEIESISGKPVPYEVTERRDGDIGLSYAGTEFALSEIGWKAELGIKEMCQDSWNWVSTNPDGFGLEKLDPQAPLPGFDKPVSKVSKTHYGRRSRDWE